MMLIFGYIRFALYPRLGQYVQAADWTMGANVLTHIRRWVLVNLTLGVVIVLITLIGVSS
jgi:uncharacterized membrane protein